MFLVTTAIEEFWDKDQIILFLGEWCKLYNRREIWSKLKYEDAPFIWEDSIAIEKALEYCNNIYEIALGELTIALNKTHNIRQDTKYYRIILGNWLFQFIHQAYDKYLTINTAFSKYPKLSTYVLDDSQYYTPIDPDDYFEKMIDDEYNLQLYSQILKEMGYHFSIKKLSHPIEQTRHIQLNVNYKKHILIRLNNFIANCLNNKTINVSSPVIEIESKKRWLALIVKSRFKYIFDDMRYPLSLDINVENSSRSETKLQLGDGQFEKVLARIIIQNLPVIYLECFKDFRQKVLSLPIKRSKIFFSTISLHFNNIYKFFIGEYYKEIKILSMQHGGGYGIEHELSIEKYEISISDIFYTWGWKNGNTTKYLPSSKLTNKRIHKITIPGNVLLVQDLAPRYLYRFQFHNSSSNVINKYYKDLVNFLQSVDENIFIKIRIYPNKFRWYFEDRLLNEGLKIHFDNVSKSFSDSLKNSYICLFDHVSTTYIESLCRNIPTIIFINPAINKFHSQAKTYIDNLEKVKILHYNPNSAAQHLNEIYTDVDYWWNSIKVQKAREEFLFSFARANDNWVNEWIKEFNRVLDT